MSPKVLLLSGLYDFSSDRIAIHLERAGIPYIRLNREEFAEWRITLEPAVPQLSVEGAEGRWIVGAGLKSVYFRQPVFLRNTPSTPLAPNEQLERSQWSAFLRGLCVFRDAGWMNFPQATYLAESKPYQLAIAAACGFRIPDTIATNDAQAVHRRFPGDLVIKSLDTVLLRDGDDCLFTYTTVTRSDPLHSDAMATAPLLAQQAMAPKTDVRVTIVGEKLFAVQILSNGEGIAGDWRTVPREMIEYRDIALDEPSAESCLLLARKLGLAFAAVDLLETPDGVFFIEVNPTGEWGWLSTPDRPIDATIASWLADPPRM